MASAMSKRIRQALVEMDRRYATSKLEGQTAAAYYEDLLDLPEDAVVDAIVACRKSAKFLPTVAEIREMAVDIIGEEMGVWVTPEQAWAEVMDKTRRFGLHGYRDVPVQDEQGEIVGMRREQLSWSSPVVKRAVEAIGWRELCTTDLEKHERTIYAQFRDAIKTEQGRVKRSIVTGRAQETGALRLPEQTGEPKAIGDVLTSLVDGMKGTRDDTPHD